MAEGGVCCRGVSSQLCVWLGVVCVVGRPEACSIGLFNIPGQGLVAEVLVGGLFLAGRYAASQGAGGNGRAIFGRVHRCQTRNSGTVCVEGH